MIFRFYRKPALSEAARARLSPSLACESEWCFNVETDEILTAKEMKRLAWLITETYEPANSGRSSYLSRFRTQIEIGPRLNFETAWSSTAVSICHTWGLTKVRRMERSLRLGVDAVLTKEQREVFTAPFYDRMTQMFYLEPISSFVSGLKPEPVRIVPVMEQGVAALEAINRERGYAMDAQDLEIWMNLFRDLKRSPTDVEVFQCAAPNSEHCRHGFFKGRLKIDGVLMPESLMQIVQTPWKKHPGNSLIAFCDDSSAIRGSQIRTLIPIKPGFCSYFDFQLITYHPTLTAETHNFPSGVSPFDGGATGGGGRIRDNECVGRGGLVIAGGAGYCQDNLHIPGYNLPWEDEWKHPEELASPLEILIRASDGISDYGNKFGEPVIYGFTRTFGMELPDGRRGWYKPIVYTVGAGQMDDRHVQKGKPEEGMLLVRIGGPDHRIGMGGGPASSMMQGENTAKLDFDAVQRGDAQTEQRMNRVVRAGVEMGDENPFVSAHDLGAVGNCNAFTELADPAGAKINVRAFPLGDPSLSVVEIWGNESQERNGFLVWPDRFDVIREIADREGISCVIVGQITGDGWLILHDDNDGTDPVKLPLDRILGAIPIKTFELARIKPVRKPLELPDSTVEEFLDRVLRLPSVGSKRFLTTKVDRSVTGLVAQQQCVGPRQITLCDFAAIAQSHFEKTGVALSLGEQPIKGLLSPQAMARMGFAEALLNMTGALISDIADIRSEANWMVAAKLPGEGAWLYDAACALRDIMVQAGPAIDGGKDSLSMAAKTKSPSGDMQIVKAPGQLVIANYAPMPNITRRVTPDFKRGGSAIVFVDLAEGRVRLGASALAQVYNQVGDDCPDVEDVPLLVRAFKAVQDLISRNLILAVHDRSDGGLIVALLEMAFAGNVGLDINLHSCASAAEFLFNEELGLVIECENPGNVLWYLEKAGICAYTIGNTTPLSESVNITVQYNDALVLRAEMPKLRAIWEETSSQIDRLQANPECVEEETKVNSLLTLPRYYRPFLTNKSFSVPMLSAMLSKPKVAILRTRGSNGDREMTSAFFMAGFDTKDVTMSDIVSGKATLDEFQGLVPVGGFADADVFDAGKGWAGTVKFNERVYEQFRRFYDRKNTFSFGVCNGCQFMALLGWIPWFGLPDAKQPRFIRNVSGRFESRFPAVKIFPSPAIMLRGMEGCVLPVHVAHGEGHCYFPDEGVYIETLDRKLAPMRFVDHECLITERYPLNPNGSRAGITALCSPDGRHLAMMPHPERAFLPWQWHYWPSSWPVGQVAPWFVLFQNAYEWCLENR